MIRKHTLEKHDVYCDIPHCNICEGGLAVCTVCHGAEASLPTHCPGYPMTYGQQGLVQDEQMDFVDGHWVVGKRLRGKVIK
jgi:hypothetical protein